MTDSSLFAQVDLLQAALVISALGLAVVARMRMVRNPKLGKPLGLVHDSGGIKPVLFAVETGLFMIALLVPEPFPTEHALFALYGAFMLTWLCPGANDRGFGDEGVFRGWYGRRYEELEEWRLTGAHLRFRLHGEWTAVELPRERRAFVREILERVAPESQSRFTE